LAPEQITNADYLLVEASMRKISGQVFILSGETRRAMAAHG